MKNKSPELTASDRDRLFRKGKGIPPASCPSCGATSWQECIYRSCDNAYTAGTTYEPEVYDSVSGIRSDADF